MERNVLSKSWRGVPFVVRKFGGFFIISIFLGHRFEKCKEVSNFLIFDTQMYNNLISSNYSKIILSYILLCGFNLNLFKHLHRI